MTNPLQESPLNVANSIQVRATESHNPLDSEAGEIMKQQIQTMVADLVDGDRRFKHSPELKYDEQPNLRILKGLLKIALSKPEDDPEYVPSEPDPDNLNAHPPINPYLNMRDNLVAIFKPKDAVDLLSIYTEPVQKSQ